MRNFRVNARAVAEAKGISLNQIAMAIRGSRAGLARVLNGYAACTIPYADGVAQALQVPLTLLLSSQADVRRWMKEQSTGAIP